MSDVFRIIEQAGVVPVVVATSDDEALHTCQALARGGLPVAEITFRTAAAAAAIARVRREMPEILVGAGTVLTVDSARQALDAGAAFLVSPGFSRAVVQFAIEKGVPVLPGCSNPTDLMAAMEMGLEWVKFFPAEPLGGLGMLKALAAPFGMLKFVPTGGIDETNLAAYLSFKQAPACGGSWMVRKELAQAGRFDEIERLTAEAVGIVRAAKGL